MQEVVENIALEQSYIARKITGREKKQIETIIAKNKQKRKAQDIRTGQYSVPANVPRRNLPRK